MKHLSKDGRCAGRNSNPASLTYNSRSLPLDEIVRGWQIHSVHRGRLPKWRDKDVEFVKQLHLAGSSICNSNSLT
jgi:hypothetical protein